MNALDRVLSKRRKLFALASAGLLVLLSGSVTTLAAWQDHQYVWGGTGQSSSGGIGSSLFGLQQSVDGSTFLSVQAGPGGQISFGLNASSLTPGDTLFGWMQLRTVTGSRGGTVTLSGATVSQTNLLSAALTYGARVGVSQSQCTLAGYASAGTELVPLLTALTTGSGSTTFAVPAATSSAPGTAVGVCFQLALPTGVSQLVGGLVTQPVWHFDATSN